jgi:trehalose 6-phosphate synthase/phosphatase
MKHRIIIVSNRLPVSVSISDNKVELIPSIGGMAVVLGAVARQHRALWIGALNLSKEDLKNNVGEVSSRLIEDYQCIPIVLSRDEIRNYYYGYSNSVLWPQFHEMPPSTQFREEWWVQYGLVNQKFAEVVLGVAEPGDILWINDYHLLLMPRLLSTGNSAAKIGLFLHIPFPKSSTFFCIPHAKDLLNGMLRANQIGVYTEKYKDRLFECIKTYLAQKRQETGEKINTVRVDVFKAGADSVRIEKALTDPVVRSLTNSLKSDYAGKKIILSADRLDHTKGILQKIRAYGRVFTMAPNLIELVEMVLIVAPCRMELLSYSDLNTEISTLVQEVNKKYSTTAWKPIHFINSSLTFEQLIAYYKLADVMVIASLEDAMNIMAKEFLLVKGIKGALVLSKFAGSAEELPNAYLIDPTNEATIADGILAALHVNDKELQDRNAPMLCQIQKQTATKWAEEFLESIEKRRGAA